MQIRCKFGAKIKSGAILAKHLNNYTIMAKVSIYHDTRSGKDEFPLKLRITHNNKKAYISLGIKVAPEQWDAENLMVVDHPKAKKFNTIATSRLTLAESLLIKMEMTTSLDSYSATQLKTMIENNGELKEEKVGHNFYDFFCKFRDSKEKAKTISSYNQSLISLAKFDEKLKERVFEDITCDYLERYDSWLDECGVTLNSRAVYYRNIRAVINQARKDELTKEYAFKNFKIKKAATKKRNLSVEELRLLKDYPIVNDFQRKYRDIFMLCFYMRGINAVDLFKLTKDNIRAGRIDYIRSKTGKFYSVKIEPEMQEIFDRYKGKDYLLDIADGAKTDAEYQTKYEGFLQRMDRNLKKIGPYTRKGLGGKKQIQPLFPKLSQYWCRHTTATLMIRMGYTVQIVCCSLGHDNGYATTNIYKVKEVLYYA